MFYFKIFCMAAHFHKFAFVDVVDDHEHYGFVVEFMT